MMLLVCIWSVLSKSMLSKSVDEPVNSGLFTEPDCIASCWMGLRPNISTSQELEQFIESNTILDSNVRDIYGEYPFATSDDLFKGTFPEGQYTVQILVRQNIVYHIKLEGLFKPNVAALVDVLGEPEYVGFGSSINPDGSLFTSYKMYYPNQGFSFDLITDDGRLDNGNVEICIDEQTLISAIQVHPIITIEELIGRNYILEGSLSPELIDNIVGNLENWKGFTCIETNPI